MTYQEILDRSRDLIGPYCKSCKICNGQACKNTIPGPGAKGLGTGFIRSYQKWQELCVNMDTICENGPVDTTFDFFGHKLALPVMAGPVAAMQLHYGDHYDDLTYNDLLVEGCAKAGILAFTGDGLNPAVMEGATKAVAADYPDVKFAAVFQNINVDGESYPNVWDTEYRGEECTYVTGVIAATLSESGILGYISGDQAAGVCEACSGFMQGAPSVDPDVDVKFMSVDSYEDPAKAKEIANAMINAGVDAFQTDAGNSQIGVIEAANEAGVYVSGDVSDNSALCPDGFYAYMGIDFGENIYLAVKQLVEGNFPGGEHGYMNIASGTYFVDTALLDALAEKMPEKADKFQAAKEAGEAAMAGIKDGSIQVVHDIELPDLDRVKGY